MRTDKRSVAPILVIGYMHSGTTLLFNILAWHSDILSSRGETKFFELLPMLRSEYADLEDAEVLRSLISATALRILRGFSLKPAEPGTGAELPLPERLVEEVFEEASEQRDYGNAFRIVFDYLARQAGKRRWLEKTPTHVFHIDEIVKSVP